MRLLKYISALIGNLLGRRCINMYKEFNEDIALLSDTNKFGYSYIRFDRKPPARLVEYFAKNYNINTDCHYSCLTCQITHIDKYKDQLNLENAKALRETGKPLDKWFPIKCNFIPKGIKGETSAQVKEIAHNLNIDEDRARKIMLSSVDPGAWTELMFGFDDKTQMEGNQDEAWYLRWYQKHLLRCSSKRIVARMGRRAGKSSSLVWKLIWYVYNHRVFAGYDSKGEKQYRGPEIVIITPFTSQVKNIFSQIERFLRLNKDLVELVNGRGVRLYTQTPPLKMEFKNGATITGYVSGANAKDDETGGGIIRGDDADIIYLDEMDMIPDSILQKVIMPLLLTRPNVILFGSSTPIGKKGSFFKWCFPAGTKVLTPEGNKKIELIKPDDIVIDAYGNGVNVIDTFRHSTDNDLIEITPWYLPPIVSTSDHPFLVRRNGKDEFIEAQYLTIGEKKHKRKIINSDYLKVPLPERDNDTVIKDLGDLLINHTLTDKIRTTSKLSKIDVCDQFSITLDQLRVLRHKLKIYGFITKDERTAKAYNIAVSLYEKIKEIPGGFALGLYLAEGCVIKGNGYTHGIKWTFNKSEVEFANLCISFIKSLGLKAKLKDKSAIDSTIEVYCYSQAIGYLFSVMFGEKEQKRVPSFITVSSITWKTGFLEGVIAGDGYERNGRWTVSLVAEKAINDLYILCLKDYNPVAIKHYSISGCQLRYSLYQISDRNQMYFWDRDSFYVRIKSLKSKSFSGAVFNLHTNVTNTYIVNNVAVHNCKESLHFKEIYAPSTVLPHWDAVENEALEESTADAFKAEYMADFIEQQAGVFKHRYIQVARTDYEYSQTEDPEFWLTAFGEDYHQFRKCIGIDWNKNAGTEFCVTAFSPKTGRFFLLETINIGPSEYSSEAYKDEVKRLNYKWKPHYIYADEGYGHTMIEDLQVEATNLGSKQNRSPYESSITELAEKLKMINFSSNLELLNPATGTYFEKYAKNFLVENAVKLMERERIRYPESDHVLIKQLGNYIVKKQMDSGKLVYGQNNEGIGDHRLDAYILALGGLALEESVYSLNYGGTPDTYFVPKKDGSEDEFESSMQEALGILKVLKKQKSAVQLDVLAIRRGNGTVEQERHIYNQHKWEEEGEKPAKQSRSDITSNKPVKGYFSKRGLATLSETRPGEEIDANYMFQPPIKIEAPNNRSLIRSKLRR